MDHKSLIDADRGPWVATASGMPWYLMDPRPEDVRIVDIAAGLSRMCRYNGQLREDIDFLAVSEHSVGVTECAIADGICTHREDALLFLLHDGSEGILGDMVSPLKKMMPEFRQIEDKTQDVILMAFGLDHATSPISHKILKRYDISIRLDERNRAIQEPASAYGLALDWGLDKNLNPLGVQIDGQNPRESRIRFLTTFIWIVENMPLRNPKLETKHQDFLLSAKDHLSRTRSRQNIQHTPEQREEKTMLFAVHDPKDNIDQATLRAVSAQSLRRISNLRKDYEVTIPNRPFLAEKSTEDRRIAFGSILIGAMILARHNAIPGDNMPEFLNRLSIADRQKPQQEAPGFLRRLLGNTPKPNTKDFEMKQLLKPVLAQWPEFDPIRWDQGISQPSEFMEEFAIDYATLREIAFEVRKPWTCMLQAETHVQALSPIYDQFETASYTGIDLARLEKALTSDTYLPIPSANPEEHELKDPELDI